MGKFYESIPPSLQPWILDQKVFFIASAPLSPTSHLNLSPKGGAQFGILSPTQFWYIDLTGSGVETLSHLHEPGNGRIVVMFMAFNGAPRIVRLWGKGEVMEVGTKGFGEFVKERGITPIPGTRAVVLVHIHQVGSSCGFSVPKYDFVENRPTLNEFFEKRVASEEAGRAEDGIEHYWALKNALSLDNLPGLKRGYDTAAKLSLKPMQKMVGPNAKKAFIPSRNTDLETREKAVRINQWLLVVMLGLLVFVAIGAVVVVERGVGVGELGVMELESAKEGVGLRSVEVGGRSEL